MGGFGEIPLPRTFSHWLVLSHPLSYFLALGCPHARMSPQAAHLLYQHLVLIPEIRDIFSMVGMALHGPAIPWVAPPPQSLLSLKHNVRPPFIYSKFSKRTRLALLPSFAQAIVSVHDTLPSASSILHTSTRLPPPSGKHCCPNKAWSGASPVWYPDPLCSPNRSVPRSEATLLCPFLVSLTRPWEQTLSLFQGCSLRAWHRVRS